MWPSYLSPETSRAGSTPSPSSGPPQSFHQQQPQAHQMAGQQHGASVEQTPQLQPTQPQFTDTSCQIAGVNSPGTTGPTANRMNMAGAVGPGAAAAGTNAAALGAAAGAAAAPTEEDELTIPRAAMNKMLKELLPNVRIANESRELVLNCCSEFIHHIATHANEVCNQHHKKTINAEHILTALDNLGFSEYCEDAQRVFADCKEVAAKRRKQSSRLEHLGVPEEELLRQQQELFAKARQEQAEQAQQDWANIQQVAVTGLPIAPNSDDDEY